MSNTEETKHHKDYASPSEVLQARDCPASFLRAREVKRGDNDPADRGTRIHNALKDDDWRGLNAEEIETANRCGNDLDGILSRIDDIDNAQAINEARVEWQGYAGTIDVLIIHSNGKEATIVDYKTGRVAVDHAERNFQLAIYAALVSLVYGIDTVHAHIIQPLVYMGHTSHTFEGADFFAHLVANAKEIVEAALEPNAPAYPSVETCRFCDAAPVCDDCVGFLGAIKKAPPCNPQEIPLEKLAALIDLAADLRGALKIIEKAEERLKEQPAGTQVGNWIVGEKKGNRRPLGINAIAEFLGQAEDVSAEQVEKHLLSNAKISVTMGTLREVMTKFFIDESSEILNVVAPHGPKTKTLAQTVRIN